MCALGMHENPTTAFLLLSLASQNLALQKKALGT